MQLLQLWAKGAQSRPHAGLLPACPAGVPGPTVQATLSIPHPRPQETPALLGCGLPSCHRTRASIPVLPPSVFCCCHDECHRYIILPCWSPGPPGPPRAHIEGLPWLPSFLEAPGADALSCPFHLLKDSPPPSSGPLPLSSKWEVLCCVPLIICPNQSPSEHSWESSSRNLNLENPG